MSFHSNMYGIIYKFTIIAKYKFDGHRPFYVGQRWETKSIDKFLSRNCSNYPGSGSIWTDFVNRLKQDYPTCWRKLIKREVLFASEMVNQKGLDVLESYYIKKEQSHYSYRKGGCNVLWGTANEFNSGSPSKDPLVRKKMSIAMQQRLKSGWRPKHSLTDKHYKEHSDFMKEYYKTHVSPNKGKTIPKEKHPMFGKRHSEESRKKMKEHHADFSGKNNPMYGVRLCGDKNPAFGKMWVTNGNDNLFIKTTDEIPQGYYKGLTRRKI